ncbi:hypothetical protein HG537_0G02440 [Torulaspora globosa]|uniref:Shugoshin C-terminal domain-containing protein n=1 Tax=Torulaspora globosa TaxID=48254 RepID=A0A7H9HX90_9SACH|nr:hypothetical protein HG537_0G02440 [Torulaspora sp. CBS 2947]
MARTLRRKTRDNGDGGKIEGVGEMTVTAKNGESIPQIQELQNLMDFQKNKVEAIKASYSQQNTQLARANSSLMMKLSDIENKISELVQENVTLRSKVSISELNYKRRLTEQLDVLENGISHRVEEIFLMFDSVRAKEGLKVTSSSDKSSQLRSILRKRRSLGSSQGDNKSTNSIQFLEAANQVIGASEVDGSEGKGDNVGDQEENAARRKRRKSSRRESIFLPEDFELPSQEPVSKPSEDGVDEQNGENDHGRTELPSTIDGFHEQEVGQTEEQVILQPTDDIELPSEHNEQNAHADGSFSFTNSIIDYSIPEEIAPSASTNTEQSSSSKIEVFRDEPESTSSSQNGENRKEQTFVPLSSQSKAKHSRRAPAARSRKSMIDEVMPTTNNGNAACDIQFTRIRRTRGKAIDYKLPSLRAKMRRPTEKLVDATTFTNIHELQVTNARRSYKKSSSRKSASSTTAAPLKETVIPGDAWRKDVSDQSQNDKEAGKLEQEHNCNKPNSKSVPPENVATSRESQPILKDITNRPKTSKTRKLLKSAIINDICDNNIGMNDDTTDSLGSNGSSFRLNEEDLSVFDLIGSDKAKPTNKTYRAKSKKLTTK